MGISKYRVRIEEANKRLWIVDQRLTSIRDMLAHMDKNWPISKGMLTEPGDFLT